MQPTSIDLTLDLCTRYPLWLGDQRKCGMGSLSDLLHESSGANQTQNVILAILLLLLKFEFELVCCLMTPGFSKGIQCHV